MNSHPWEEPPKEGDTRVYVCPDRTLIPYMEFRNGEWTVLDPNPQLRCPQHSMDEIPGYAKKQGNQACVKREPFLGQKFVYQPFGDIYVYDGSKWVWLPPEHPWLLWCGCECTHSIPAECSCSYYVEEEEECREGDIRYYTCPDGSKVPWCHCVNGEWVCKYNPALECPGQPTHECTPGETRFYTCPDGSKVEWCKCNQSGIWECIENPQEYCPQQPSPEPVEPPVPCPECPKPEEPTQPTPQPSPEPSPAPIPSKSSLVALLPIVVWATLEYYHYKRR